MRSIAYLTYIVSLILLSPLPTMIQLQQNLVVRPEYCRMLAPLRPIREGRSLQGLADVACLEEPGVYSPATSPRSSISIAKDYISSMDPCIT